VSEGLVVVTVVLWSTELVVCGVLVLKAGDILVVVVLRDVLWLDDWCSGMNKDLL
jgi:hypothetical protein